MPAAVTRQAYAKLNLALSVGPPIAEGLPGAGLHPIASWMVPIALTDAVTVEPRADGSGIELHRSWADEAPLPRPMRWGDEQDLAVRALRRLGAAAGRELGARVVVEKRIPFGGGLGGGSSDAAVCLLAANAAFGLGRSVADLAELGAMLGSDVPFFLDEPLLDRDGPPRAALVTGTGDRVERIETRPAPLLLILPPFGCATAEVFDAFDDGPVTLDEPAVRTLASGGDPSAAGLFNDLRNAACRVEPRLAEVLREAERVVGGSVHVSGSGSALFAVGEQAERRAASLGLRLAGAACLGSWIVDASAGGGSREGGA